MKSEKIRHVAIIMDGNGRWAERRGLSRVEGHRQGALQVSEVVKAAQEYGVEFLTLYAFSTENWKRPKTEVAALMGLLEKFIDEKLPELIKSGIQLRVLGRIEELSTNLYNKILHAIEMTKENKEGVLNLAINYGGRAEIVDAVNKIMSEVKKNNGNFPKITENSFGNYLYAPDIPDPDLLIRTAGELRLSNFLLWEISYSELYVTDTLWPDFGKSDFAKAIQAYSQRDRRFGGRK